MIVKKEEHLSPPTTKYPLYLTSWIHIEPFAEYRTKEGHALASRNLKRLGNVFKEHEAKMTFLSELDFAEACLKYGNTLEELEDAGHEVGTHIHGFHIVGLEEQREYARKRKEAVDRLGVRNITVCGGWNIENPFKEFVDLGFSVACGYSEHTPGVKGSRIRGQDLPQAPWRPVEGSGWTTDWMRHDPEGRIVYVPFAGELWIDWAEHGRDLRNIPLMESEVKRYVGSWKEVIDSVFSSMVPGKINHRSLYVTCHEEAIADYEEMLERQMRSIGEMLDMIRQDYVKTGKVVWETISGVAQKYIAWESYVDSLSSSQKSLSI